MQVTTDHVLEPRQDFVLVIEAQRHFAVAVPSYFCVIGNGRRACCRHRVRHVLARLTPSNTQRYAKQQRETSIITQTDTAIRASDKHRSRRQVAFVVPTSACLNSQPTHPEKPVVFAVAARSAHSPASFAAAYGVASQS